MRGVGGVGGGGVWEGYAHAICTCDRGGGGGGARASQPGLHKKRNRKQLVKKRC